MKIVNAAWEQDEDWGTFVWLTLVTGARRSELLALVWDDVDLVSGVLTIRRNLVSYNGKTIVKDTKTHQMRRISLDEATVEILEVHKKRCADRCMGIGIVLDDGAFIFSYSPDYRRPCNPSAITHRYTRMTAKLGLRTHLHALRHYSATELLAAGVDLRTVAGRLGHGGGGSTTLKVYAAWVAGADKKAAHLIASRLPRPPQALPDDRAQPRSGVDQLSVLKALWPTPPSSALVPSSDSALPTVITFSGDTAERNSWTQRTAVGLNGRGQTGQASRDSCRRASVMGDARPMSTTCTQGEALLP